MSTKLKQALLLAICISFAAFAQDVAINYSDITDKLAGEYNLKCGSSATDVIENYKSDKDATYNASGNFGANDLASQTSSLVAKAKEAGVSAGAAMQSAANNVGTETCAEFTQEFGNAPCKIYVHRTGTTQAGNSETLLYYLQIGDQYCGKQMGANAGSADGGSDYGHYSGWYHVTHAQTVLSDLANAAISEKKRQLDEAKAEAAQMQAANEEVKECEEIIKNLQQAYETSSANGEGSENACQYLKENIDPLKESSCANTGDRTNQVLIQAIEYEADSCIDCARCAKIMVDHKLNSPVVESEDVMNCRYQLANATKAIPGKCCDAYSKELGAIATGLGEVVNRDSVPGIISSSDNGREWVSWFENNAKNSDPNRANHFCGTPLYQDFIPNFCGTDETSLMKQTHEKYCADRCPANINDLQADIDARMAATGANNQNECNNIIADYEDQTKTTLSDKCRPKCPEEEGRHEETPDPSFTKGPCDEIANFGAYIRGQNKINNPYLAHSNKDYLEGNLFEELTAKKEIITTKKEAFDGAIYDEEAFFNGCQRLATEEWGDMVGSRTNASALDQSWALSWAIFSQALLEKYHDAYLLCKDAENELIDEKMKSGGNSRETIRSGLGFKEVLDYASGMDRSESYGKLHTFQDDIKASKEEALNRLIKVRKCTALVQMTYETDYSDPEAGTEKRKASSDGSIECIRNGALTQDYKSCDAVITAYDVALVAQQVLVAGQQIDFTGKQTDFQAELLKDEDQVKGPIKMQIKTLETQKGYAEAQGAGHMAKAAALEVVISGMPTINNLIDNCQKGFSDDAGHRDYAFVMSKIFGDENIISQQGEPNIDPQLYGESYAGEAICGETIKSNKKLRLIVNDTGKQQGHTAAIQAGIKAAEQVMVATVIQKNINKLKTILAGVEDFEPADLNYTIEDLVAQECEINPTAPACSSATDSATSVGFSGQSFSISGTGRSGTGDYTLPDQDGIVSSTATDSGTLADGDKFAPISSGISGSGGISNAVGRGSVKSTIGGASGSSGGVSAGRVAAPSGGSRRSGARSTASRYKAKDYSYRGKSKGISYGSGGSRSRSKSSKSNPFAKLFNKSAKGKKDIINFRELASKGEIGTQSGRNLFRMISDRYDNVEKNKQLLEYQKVK